jgi:hypothetical protein
MWWVGGSAGRVRVQMWLPDRPWSSGVIWLPRYNEPDTVYYEQPRGIMTVYAGLSDKCVDYCSDLWFWDTLTGYWYQEGGNSSFYGPFKRWQHVGYNYNNQLLVFGGHRLGTFLNDVWLLDVRTFIRFTTPHADSTIAFACVSLFTRCSLCASVPARDGAEMVNQQRRWCGHRCSRSTHRKLVFRSAELAPVRPPVFDFNCAFVLNQCSFQFHSLSPNGWSGLPVSLCACVRFLDFTGCSNSYVSFTFLASSDPIFASPSFLLDFHHNKHSPSPTAIAMSASLICVTNSLFTT